jgi:hypothetical protein
MEWESNAILLQDVSVRVEVVTVDTPLGGDDAHTEVVTSRSGDVAGGDALDPLPPGALAWTWW